MVLYQALFRIAGIPVAATAVCSGHTSDEGLSSKSAQVDSVGSTAAGMGIGSTGHIPATAVCQPELQSWRRSRHVYQSQHWQSGGSTRSHSPIDTHRCSILDLLQRSYSHVHPQDAQPRNLL